MGTKERLLEIEREMAALRTEKASLEIEGLKGNFTLMVKGFEAAKNDFSQKVKAELGSIVASMMRTSDDIHTVSMTAYTPYFSDGDACYYRVRNDYLDVNYNLEGTSEEDSWYESPIIKEISNILKTVPDWMFMDMFGDHVRITFHRDGTVDTTEYNHD